MAWLRKQRAPAEAADATAQEKLPHEQAADDMVAYEALDEVPRDPRDWPQGKMTYLTFGNDGDTAYGDGATGKLGPAEVTHHEDGSVSVAGKLVDDPSKYKGKPITGGIIEQLTQNAERHRSRKRREKP